MISVPPGVRICLAARPVDMLKGFDGLAAVVQQHLGQDPFSGQIFAFRGKRGDLLKLLLWDGQGFLIPPTRNLCKGGRV
ncbi:transposase (plasmid) [Azospirillum argentinense]|uniref:Transposase n=1 Tax=Azospirillum argentinense TaxID=2970906 RepID=A0A4D8PTQ6_9PROT|nr:IS66 family insertion sequence element accessory protein TnpB [Azospirillum argentinense]QCO00178.1 transposase [Azospirillum argentinense]